MKDRRSRRIPPSSAYIGAGNKTSVFSRKARKPFQEMADIYKKEARKLKGNEDKNIFKQLSIEDKKLIRDRILRKKKNDERKFYFILLLSVLITIFVVGSIVSLLRKYYF